MAEIIEDWRQPGERGRTVRLYYDPSFEDDVEVYGELQQNPDLVVWGRARPDIEDYIHRIHLSTLNEEIIAVGAERIRRLAAGIGTSAYEAIALKIEQDGDSYRESTLTWGQRLTEALEAK